MPNMIIGLKYDLSDEIRGDEVTEEKLLTIFKDLRKEFSGLCSFRFNSNGKIITNFRDFLEIAVKKDAHIGLRGSGDIGGLVVNNASLNYDVSDIYFFVEYWDQMRDGSCHSCCDQVRIHDGCDNDWECKTGAYGRGGCDDYKAGIQNAAGEPARKLHDLIETASK